MKSKGYKLTWRRWHFDLYAQALAKVERSHAQDIVDIEEMLRRGLVEPNRARRYFQAIEADQYRYPAVDPKSFRQGVEAIFPTSCGSGRE